MNIREKLNQIPPDKFVHFLVGWALVALLYPHGPVSAFVCVIILAAWKEWDDAHGHGTPDFWDFLVTVVGGVAAALAHVVLGWL